MSCVDSVTEEQHVHLCRYSGTKLFCSLTISAAHLIYIGVDKFFEFSSVEASVEEPAEV